jgi:hypothetical protein
MIAVNGAVKTLIDEKVRRRTLLTELRAQPLFKFINLLTRKNGVKENKEGQGKPAK